MFITCIIIFFKLVALKRKKMTSSMASCGQRVKQYNNTGQLNVFMSTQLKLIR